MLLTNIAARAFRWQRANVLDKTKTGQHLNRATQFVVKIIIVLFIYWFSYFKNYQIFPLLNITYNHYLLELSI